MKLYGQAFAGLLLMTVVVITGCKQSMVISKVNYSQPIESVVTPDEDGTVKDERYGLEFNMLPIQYMETQDTTSVTTSEIRYIRGASGLYYVTAPAYQHVYLMAPGVNELEFREKFKISETGIDEPAFNQREGFVQLVNRSTGERYRLTPEGLEEEGLTTTTEDQ